MATQYSRESENQPKPQYSFCFVPVTIAMLLKVQPAQAQESLKTIYTLVCRIEDYEESGDISFQDETGTISGKIYKNLHKNAVHATHDFVYRKGEYVSVVGNITNVSGKNVLVVNRINNVTSYKEVDFHRAQIIWALLIKNSVIKVPSPGQGARMEVEHVGGEMNSDQKMVFNFIRANSKGQEIKVDDIKRGVRMNPNKIEAALNELVNAGELIEYDGFTSVKLA